MNLREGTRRLAQFLGVAGAVLGGLISCAVWPSITRQSTEHNRFEQLASSDVVQQERKKQAGWQSIDPQTGESVQWEQQVDKGGIKTIHWTKDNTVESIETDDGQTLYRTPTPSAWQYILIALLPVLGFVIPWGTIRAIGWVGAGFVTSSK